MAKTNDQKPATTFSTIGRSTAMIDAAEKDHGPGQVCGRLRCPGMLTGKILHSPIRTRGSRRLIHRRPKLLRAWLP